MKKYIVSLLVILAILIGCQKDELFPSTEKQEVTSNRLPSGLVVLDNIDSNYVSKRDGQRDLIFFRNSLTTDNYLLTVGTDVQREHRAYNKFKVAYVRFNLGLIDPINFGGVPYEHYKVFIMYKDSTYEKLVAYSKDSLDNFTYYPLGENVLRDAHPAKSVTWTKTSKLKSSINEFRGAGLISVPQWVIKYDSSIIVTDYRNPISKQGNLFQPPHKN